tara:strand:+ start:152 stop:406 length:255 start_codon:yes stop_codon:yes gene_type:complete
MSKETKITERQEMVVKALKFYKKDKDIVKLDRVLNRIYTSGGFNEDGCSNLGFFIKQAIRMTNGNVKFIKDGVAYIPKKSKGNK